MTDIGFICTNRYLIIINATHLKLRLMSKKVGICVFLE